MQNYFAEKIEPGAPNRADTHRRVKTQSKNDAKRRNFKTHYFGIPKDQNDPLYNTIINIDAVARKQVMPVIAPLQINFTATGKKRDTLIENLENWDILRNSKVICGADDASFSLACDNVGTYAAAVKIGNEFISKNDAIYRFKGAPIIMAKTIITKTSRITMESQMLEPTETCEFKMKILKPLDLGPFLEAVSDFNTELGVTGTNNVYRKLKNLDLLAEPRPPTNDHVALNIHDNYHGGDDNCLTRWLSSLIKYDIFLAQFESLRNELDRRKKNDKDRLPPLGVTFALGKSNLEKIDTTLKTSSKTPPIEEEEEPDESLKSEMGTLNCGTAQLELVPETGKNQGATKSGKKKIKKINKPITASQLGRAIDAAENQNLPTPELNNRPQSTPSKAPKPPLPSQGRVIKKAIKSLSDTLKSAKKREHSPENSSIKEKVAKIDLSDEDVTFSDEDLEKSRIPIKKDDSKNSSGTSHYEEPREKIQEELDQANMEELGIIDTKPEEKVDEKIEDPAMEIDEKEKTEAKDNSTKTEVTLNSSDTLESF